MEFKKMWRTPSVKWELHGEKFLDNVCAASNEHPVKSLTITDVSIVG